MIENVPNMLDAGQGQSDGYLVGEIESLGYRWAYRRRRLALHGRATARQPGDLAGVGDRGPAPSAVRRRRGRASPRLTSGTTPSASTGPKGSRRARMGAGRGPDSQGRLDHRYPVPARHLGAWAPTRDASSSRRRRGRRGDAGLRARLDRRPGHRCRTRTGPRWKLVGNAVTTRVAEWVAGRIAEPGDPVVDLDGPTVTHRWPTAAWGENGAVSLGRRLRVPSTRALRAPLVRRGSERRPTAERAGHQRLPESTLAGQPWPPRGLP